MALLAREIEELEYWFEELTEIDQAKFLVLWCLDDPELLYNTEIRKRFNECKEIARDHWQPDEVIVTNEDGRQFLIDLSGKIDKKGIKPKEV